MTEGYEGFIHLTQSTGTVESTELRYIIRNHDEKKLKDQEQILLDTARKINTSFNGEWIQVFISPSYANMKPILEKKPDALKRALEAYKSLSLKVSPVPIRGGTDGAKLTYKGVPTPNLATGGENYHGKYEFLVVEDAETMVRVLREIIRVKV
jgi:tripeptide aminopeptidase